MTCRHPLRVSVPAHDDRVASLHLPDHLRHQCRVPALAEAAGERGLHILSVASETPSPHSANIGTVIGMLLVAFVLCIPDMKYDLEMTRKGHGYAAINNAFSSQVMVMSLGFGLPVMIRGFASHEGLAIPSYKLVTQSVVMLSCAVIAFILMSLVPSLISRDKNCKLDDMRGKILGGITFILIIVFVVLSLRKQM